jgi:hypothetical protein
VQPDPGEPLEVRPAVWCQLVDELGIDQPLCFVDGNQEGVFGRVLANDVDREVRLVHALGDTDEVGQRSLLAHRRA